MNELTQQRIYTGPDKHAYAVFEDIRRLFPEVEKLIDAVPAGSGSADLLWGVAQDHWINAAGNGSYVDCHKCADKDGGTPTTDDVRVYLPRNADGDPNVSSGDVVGYIVDANDVAVCMTDYMDAKIGTLRVWNTAASVPDGWQVADGTNGTLDLRDRFPIGYGTTYNVVGAQAGTSSHVHPDHALQNHLGHSDHTIADHCYAELDLSGLSSGSFKVLGGSGPGNQSHVGGTAPGLCHDNNHCAHCGDVSGGKPGLSHPSMAHVPPYTTVVFIQRVAP